MRIHRFTALVLMAALFLAAMGEPALAQGTALSPIALNYADWVVLIDESGKELTPRGEYAMITPLNSGMTVNTETETIAPAGAYALYAAIPARENPDMRYALMDQKGQLLTEALYDLISPLDSEHLLFMQNGYSGVMDTAGQVVLEAEYTHIISNGAGGYLALRTDPYNEEPDGVYHIDEAGNERATGVKVSYPFYFFSEGLCAAASSDGKYGYLGTDGRWAIPPQFVFAGDFVSGGAVTNLSSGSGVIDPSGNWIISPKYRWIDRVSTGMLAIQGSTLSLMKPDGTLIKDYEVADSVGSYVCNERYGVVALESETLLVDIATGATLLSQSPGTIYNVWNTPEDRVIVNGGNYGEKCVYLYTTSGEKISGPYQELIPLGSNNGTDCFGFAEFNTLPADDGGYQLADDASYRMGLIDRDGNLLLPAEYTQLYQIMDNRFLAETTEWMGIIDVSGQWIVQYPLESREEQPAE